MHLGTMYANSKGKLTEQKICKLRLNIPAVNLRKENLISNTLFEEIKK